MKKQTLLAFMIYVVVYAACYSLKINLTNFMSLIFFLFFSVAMAFYLGCFFVSQRPEHLKFLHDFIEEKTQRRGTHILKQLFLSSCRCSVVSVLAVVLFCMVEDDGFLCSTSSCALISLLFVNVFYIFLWLNVVADSAILKSKD